MKILLLWDRMGDYHRARWSALEKIVGETNVFGADLLYADNLYKWDNTDNQQNYICLSGKDNTPKSTRYLFSKFKQVVKDNKIDTLCIPGYGRLVYILMLFWARLKGKKVIMFAESWYPHKIKIVDRLKGYFVKYTTTYVFASGERAKQHFTKNLKYPANRIITSYSVVNNHHFSQPTSQNPIPETRNSKLETKNPKIILSIARFAPEKNLNLLINAFAKSKLLALNFQLIIIGGGPLKDQLQNQIDSLNMQNHIQLIDWVSYIELPGYYQQASCFILPSKFEPWGLVVNEAMAAGLPVICSDAVGAVPELCKESNSWVFQSGSEDELITTLNKLGETPEEKLKLMGKSSQEIIKEYSCEMWAKKISEA